MAETIAKSSFGALIYREDSPPGSGNYTKVAEVRDITPPNFQRTALEVTHHESPNGWRENIKGLKDMGEVSFQVNWLIADPTHGTSSGLLQDFTEDDDLFRWRVYVTTAVYIEFKAMITSFQPTLAVDGSRVVDITLKCSGEPTFSGL